MGNIPSKSPGRRPREFGSSSPSGPSATTNEQPISEPEASEVSEQVASAEAQGGTSQTSAEGRPTTARPPLYARRGRTRLYPNLSGLPTSGRRSTTRARDSIPSSAPAGAAPGRQDGEDEGHDDTGTDISTYNSEGQELSATIGPQPRVGEGDEPSPDVTPPPPEIEEDLEENGILLSIGDEAGVRRVCVRLRPDEDDLLNEGWDIANFLSTRGNARLLRRQLQFARPVENSEADVASLPARVVLQRIATSRRGNPFYCPDNSRLATHPTIKWAYHIDLWTSTLLVYGPLRIRANEADEDHPYADAWQHDWSRLPGLVQEYTFDRLNEFRSRAEFIVDVFLHVLRDRTRTILQQDEPTGDRDTEPTGSQPDSDQDDHGGMHRPSNTPEPSVGHGDPDYARRTPPRRSLAPSPDAQVGQAGAAADDSRWHWSPLPAPRPQRVLRSPFLYKPTAPPQAPQAPWGGYGSSQAQTRPVQPSPWDAPQAPAATLPNSPQDGAPLPGNSNPVGNQSPAAHERLSSKRRSKYNRWGSPRSVNDTPSPPPDHSLDYGQDNISEASSDPQDPAPRQECELSPATLRYIRDFRRARRAPDGSLSREDERFVDEYIRAASISPDSRVIIRLPAAEDESSSPVPAAETPRDPRMQQGGFVPINVEGGYTPAERRRRPSPQTSGDDSSPLELKRDGYGVDNGSPTRNVKAASRAERRRTLGITLSTSPALDSPYWQGRGQAQNTRPQEPGTRAENPIDLCSSSDGETDDTDDAGPPRKRRRVESDEEPDSHHAGPRGETWRERQAETDSSSDEDVNYGAGSQRKRQREQQHEAIVIDDESDIYDASPPRTRRRTERDNIEQKAEESSLPDYESTPPEPSLPDYRSTPDLSSSPPLPSSRPKEQQQPEEEESSYELPPLIPGPADPALEQAQLYISDSSSGHEDEDFGDIDEPPPPTSEKRRFEVTLSDIPELNSDLSDYKSSRASSQKAKRPRDELTLSDIPDLGSSPPPAKKARVSNGDNSRGAFPSHIRPDLREQAEWDQQRQEQYNQQEVTPAPGREDEQIQWEVTDWHRSSSEPLVDDLESPRTVDYPSETMNSIPEGAGPRVPATDPFQQGAYAETNGEGEEIEREENPWMGERFAWTLAADARYARHAREAQEELWPQQAVAREPQSSSTPPAEWDVTEDMAYPDENEEVSYFEEDQPGYY